MIKRVWPVYSVEMLAQIYKMPENIIHNAIFAFVRKRHFPDAVILEIRKRAVLEPHAALSREFKIDKSAIRRIVNGESYKHVPLVKQLSKIEKGRALHLKRKEIANAGS